jgi:hypothetical protein
VNLLKGERLMILLDELPPYFEYAESKAIGNSDLSVVTATALSQERGHQPPRHHHLVPADHSRSSPAASACATTVICCRAARPARPG